MEEAGKKSIEIVILGQNTRIRHEDEKYVRKLENFIGKKLENVQKDSNITTLQAAARVLLVVADEYFSVKREREGDQKLVDDKAQAMIEFIDKNTALDQ